MGLNNALFFRRLNEDVPGFDQILLNFDLILLKFLIGSAREEELEREIATPKFILNMLFAKNL